MRKSNKDNKNKLLTPLELKVMNILWKLKKAVVWDILKEWPGPEADKPKYNTVSTIVRLLEDREFVNHNAFGRTHQYFPVVSRYAYQKRLMSSVLENAFSGSVSGLVTALLDNKDLSENEVKEIEDMINKSDK